MNHYNLPGGIRGWLFTLIGVLQSSLHWFRCALLKPLPTQITMSTCRLSKGGPQAMWSSVGMTSGCTATTEITPP